MAKKTTTKITSSIGTKGLKRQMGQINEEYQGNLKSWNRECKMYLEMRDNATIGTLLDAIKLPLLAADFDVVPGGDKPGDEKAARFLWDNLNGMNKQSWRSHVEDCLSALDFGWAIGEVTLKKHKDGKLWIKNIDPRGQETLHQWKYGKDEDDKDDKSEDDELTAFVQSDSGMFTIPIDKCVHIAYRGRKGNPQGKSLLRSLYRSYRFLKDLENLEGIGIERDIGGMPVAEMPENVYLQDPDLTKLDETLESLRNDECAYIRLPAGVKLTPYASSSKAYDIGLVIERKKKEILMRFFAQFLELGMSNVGTQALVEGSQDFFSVGIRSVQQCLLEAWNFQLVPLLFHYNHFAGMTQLPEITWHDPGAVDVKKFIDAYSTGVTSQLITPIREDEERARAMMDLPDLPEGEGEGNREPEPSGGGLWG